MLVRTLRGGNISRDAQRVCGTKEMNKDINRLLSSPSPLVFVFIGASQTNLFQRSSCELSPSIKAGSPHNLQPGEAVGEGVEVAPLLPSWWLCGPWVSTQLCESPLITTSSNKVTLLKQNAETNTASQLIPLFVVWL